MSELFNRNRVLIIDSGGGYGGPGAFLQYLLKYLDKDKFQPVVAFYFYHASPETRALQEMGVPVLFLSGNRALAHYLQSKFLSGGSKWKWLNLGKELLRFLLLFILIDVSQVWRLLSILKRNRIDLIVLNNDVHYHRVSALAARISGIPCICRKAGGIGEGKLFKKILTPWIDLFIAISAATSGDQLENKEIDPRCQYFLEQLTFTDAASLSTDAWNTADPGSQRCNTVIMDIIIEHDQVNPIPLQDAQKSPDLRYVDQNEEQEEAKELFAQVEPLPFRPARQKLGLEIVRQRTISAEEEHGNAHLLQRSRLWRGVVEVEGYDRLELVSVQVL